MGQKWLFIERFDPTPLLIYGVFGPLTPGQDADDTYVSFALRLYLSLSRSLTTHTSVLH